VKEVTGTNIPGEKIREQHSIHLPNLRVDTLKEEGEKKNSVWKNKAELF